MKRLAAVAAAIISLSAMPLWSLSSVSGYAGAPPSTERLDAALDAAAVSPECRDILGDWYVQDVRRRVSMLALTEPLFTAKALSHAERYGARGCPSSGILVAGQASRREAEDKRAASGMKSFVGTKAVRP